MPENLDRIKADLRKELSPRRWRHTESVARWAKVLAKIHGADPDKAYLAGILHDAAKEFSADQLKKIARREKLPVPGWDAIAAGRRWNLLHAYVSAWRARTVWGVRDREILSAVAAHTLGRRPMGRLDAVLYVADFSSPDRRYADARKVRAIARRDLAAALRESVRHKLDEVLKRGARLHPETVKLWNSLIK